MFTGSEFCGLANKVIPLFIARDLEILDELEYAGGMLEVVARMWDVLQLHYQNCPRCREKHFRLYAIADEQNALGVV